MTDLSFQGILPNWKKAEIDVEKFFHYSMDPSSIGNQNKWIAFQKIGYRLHDADSRWKAVQDVITQLKESLAETPARRGKNTQYGQRYKVLSQIVGPAEVTGTLITIWQIDKGKTIPRLITNWLEVHS